MNQFAGILLHMDLVDTHRLRIGAAILSRHLDLYRTIPADGQIQLRDLIVLRVIGIEIIFSVKFTILCDGTIRRKTYCHRIFYHLFIQHRERSRHTGTHRAGVGVGSAAERCGTAAEYFRLRGKLYMNFQTDDGFILFCHSNLHSADGSFHRRKRESNFKFGSAIRTKYLSVSALLLCICVYFPLFYFTLCS